MGRPLVRLYKDRGKRVQSYLKKNLTPETASLLSWAWIAQPTQSVGLLIHASLL